ncbi:MAG: hypothetical protein AB7I32_18375 [Gammaproteobacteria bacterium]
MAMPLIETISLLATLAGAVQGMRQKSSPDAPSVATEAAEASGVVLAYDLAKTQYESSVERLQSTDRQITLVASLTAMLTLLAVVGVRAIESEADLGSGFLMGALVLMLVVVAGAVLLRTITAARVISARALLDRTDTPLQLMEDYARLAAGTAELNDAAARTRALGADLLLICAAVEAVLLSVWVLTL